MALENRSITVSSNSRGWTSRRRLKKNDAIAVSFADKPFCSHMLKNAAVYKPFVNGSKSAWETLDWMWSNSCTARGRVKQDTSDLIPRKTTNACIWFEQLRENSKVKCIFLLDGTQEDRGTPRLHCSLFKTCLWHKALIKESNTECSGIRCQAICTCDPGQQNQS